MSKIFIPQPRFNKREIFKKHTTLLNNSNPKILIIGDSIVANLCFFPETWNHFFARYNTSNLGVAGDKVEHVRWRIQNSTFPESVTNILICVGTNNIEVDTPEDIGQGVILCGIAAKHNAHRAFVSIIPLLPREKLHSQNRTKNFEIHSLLKKKCNTNRYE